jgi:hypothetical protein
MFHNGWSKKKAMASLWAPNDYLIITYFEPIFERFRVHVKKNM